jgi:hypothetical protein
MIRPGFLSSADRLKLEACVRRQREDHGVARRANALRANKSETIEWLKFTLEGVGERTHGYAFEDTAF